MSFYNNYCALYDCIVCISFWQVLSNIIIQDYSNCVVTHDAGLQVFSFYLIKSSLVHTSRAHMASLCNLHRAVPPARVMADLCTMTLVVEGAHV